MTQRKSDLLHALAFSVGFLFGFCFVTYVMGQTVPRVAPFGVNAPAYQLGFSDGSRAATQPATPVMTASIANPIDREYTIAAGGSLAAAFAQAQRDHAQWPAFHFTPGQTYTLTCAIPKGFAGVTIDGGPSLSNCARIISDASGPGYAAIAALNMPNVQIRNLVFSSTPTAASLVPARAIYSNGTSGLIVENCLVNGFAIGVCSDGGSNTLITHSGFFNQSAPKIGKSQGVFLASSKDWRIEGCTFFHCGWADSDYNASGNAATIAAQNAVLQLNHGIYINNDSGLTSDGVIAGNIFVDCACSGINSRTGGNYSYNVFRSNGMAADVVIQGATGSVTHSAFFGPSVDRAPYFGGGIDGISLNLLTSANYFFSAAQTQQNPAVRVDWPAKNGPLPAGTLGNVGDQHGVWARTAVGVTTGRPASIDGIDIRVPAAGEKLPTLESYYGCTAADLEGALRARVGQNDAAAIVDWAARSWGAMSR